MPASSPKRVVARGSRSAGDKEASLQVMVPVRIKREVSVCAAQEGVTQRTIILRALKAIGFVVNDDEMCDKRKVR